jgi:hypothetical protein
MTASHPPGAPALASRTQESTVTCRPMSHQNSGDHGHEMYPQQFVRLVGCHDVQASVRPEPGKVKLH